MKESRSAKKPAAAAEAEPNAAPLSESDLPEDGGIRLTLPGFEGPLDLLLHLIQEHELDILNIPIAFITKKYLEYIGLMQELDIDIASEYLVMAATLAHIKSRMLLPTPPADLEEGEEEELDPRAELIRRLLEYQKYKKAAEELASRSVLGRDIFLRPAQPGGDPSTAPLAPVSSFKLLEAFQRVLTRAKISIDHQIEFERFSLSDRINQLVDLLKGRGRVVFEELFDGQHSRADLIVTFLALLELTRLRMTRLFQEGSLEPIFIELSVVDEEGVNAAGAEGATTDGAIAGGESSSAVPQPDEPVPPAAAGPSNGGVDSGSAPEARAHADDEDEELEDELDDFDLASLGLDDDELDDDELEEKTSGQAELDEPEVEETKSNEGRLEEAMPEPGERDEHEVEETKSNEGELDEAVPEPGQLDEQATDADSTPLRDDHAESTSEVVPLEAHQDAGEDIAEVAGEELAAATQEQSSPESAATQGAPDQERDEQTILEPVDAAQSAEVPVEADPEESPPPAPPQPDNLTDEAISPSADSELELK